MTPACRPGTLGFSLVEAVIAVALLLVVAGALAAVVDPSHNLFRTESRRIDVQQRVRTVTVTLTDALRMAGAGPHTSAAGGPLSAALAPVLPFRATASGGDPAGTARGDAITVVAVPFANGEATLALPLAVSDAFMVVDTGTCSALVAACGFAVGDTALVFDGSGRWAAFAITGVDAAVLSVRLASPGRGDVTEFASGTVVVAATLVSFYLSRDPLTGRSQLMASNGSIGAPVADDVAEMTFEYYADPAPPLKSGPRCAFDVDPATDERTPRLAYLPSADGALVTLSYRQLVDGPWCPDSESSARWDADLLRVRAIGVTIRFIGPEGVGETTRFVVTPPNLSLGR